jgi:hypothetical protein
MAVAVCRHVTVDGDDRARRGLGVARLEMEHPLVHGIDRGRRERRSAW